MEFSPFKTKQGDYRLRHGNVWAILLLSDQLMETLEPEALGQLRSVMELPGVDRALLTPDAHVGYGFPIGTTVYSKTHIYPDVVGPDPACSVALSRLADNSLLDEDLRGRRKVLQEIGKRVSVGNKRVPGQLEPLPLDEFIRAASGYFPVENSYTHAMNKEPGMTSELMDLLEGFYSATHGGQIGSIGGGNHFLSLDKDYDGNLYLMTHFGSRGVGAVGAKYFEGAIAREMELWGSPRHGNLIFAPVESRIGKLYLEFQYAMLNYSTYMHRMIHGQLMVELFDGGEFLGHIPHNFIEEHHGTYVGRKGATPAYSFLSDKVPLLVPGSMSTGSYVLRPTEGTYDSVAHGAGRVMSRKAAREAFSQEEVNTHLFESGVITNARNAPIDESSFAYKDVEEVVNSLVELGAVEVTNRLHTIMSLKG